MLLWGRIGFSVALLTLVTLPFDRLLNRSFVVLPLCVVCVTVGLISLYICTLPEKSQHSRGGGAP